MMGMKIRIVKGLNTCWRRLVTCKELFHVLFDCPEFQRLDLQEHIESSLYVQLNGNGSVQAEFYTEIAAMEFLFPYKDREAILKHNSNPDTLELAKRYMVPQFYIEKYLGVKLMELCGAIDKILHPE
jgi:hypothetical protein